VWIKNVHISAYGTKAIAIAFNKDLKRLKKETNDLISILPQLEKQLKSCTRVTSRNSRKLTVDENPPSSIVKDKSWADK